MIRGLSNGHAYEFCGARNRRLWKCDSGDAGDGYANADGDAAWQ
jgi:hypothetical protein